MPACGDPRKTKFTLWSEHNSNDSARSVSVQSIDLTFFFSDRNPRYEITACYIDPATTGMTKVVSAPDLHFHLFRAAMF